MAEDVDYGYAGWKLRNANHYLQLPDSDAEDRRMAKAIANCSLALNELESRGSLGDPAQGLADRLRGLVDACALDDLGLADEGPAERREASPDAAEQLPILIAELAAWVEQKSGEATADDDE